MNAGEKVFVVTSGNYSDYGIVGIFRSKEDAEKYMKTYSLEDTYNDYNDIEEYVLNYGLDRAIRGYKAYRIWMGLESGVMDTPEIMDSPHKDPESSYHVIGETYRVPDKTSVRCDVWAKNDQQAIKLAAEWRQAYLRNNGE